MKTYTIAGYSNLNGRVKLRVATGSIARRVSVLKSAGHRDINLVELPNPLTREAAAAYIEREFAGVTLFKPKVTAPNAVRDQFIVINSDLDVVFTPESVDA